MKEDETGIVLRNQWFNMILAPHGRLTFSDGVTVEKRAGKNAGQMRDLLWDKDAPDDEPLYDFFVGVSHKEHTRRMAESGLRYDVIVVQPGTLGGEFKKTSGHRHKASSQGVEYPEIYEVLYGTAMFVLQKSRDGVVEDAAVVRTEAGRKIIVPPGYAHATVNVGDTPLVFSDLVYSGCENEYGEIQQRHGMAYYLFERNNTVRFMRNPAYEQAAPLRALEPVELPGLGIRFGTPIYDILAETPQVFSYLADPRGRQEVNALIEKEG